jgi:hypothetical protein
LENNLKTERNLEMSEYHLAQINIARMLTPIDDPVMAEFVAQLPPINALAEASPGFVWRLQSESGDATSIKVYDDEFIIVNLTVWETVEALRQYVYKSAHSGVMRDRRRWFEKFEGPYYALWWIPAGSLPDPEEGKDPAGSFAAAWRYPLCFFIQTGLSAAF